MKASPVLVQPRRSPVSKSQVIPPGPTTRPPGENTEYQRDLSVSCNKLGDVAVTTGKLDDARNWFERGFAAIKALTAADPSNAQWQGDLSTSYLNLGEVAVSAGKLDEARTWFEKALAIRKPLTVASPSNTGWQRDLCTTLARMAAVAPTPDEAARYRREARVIYEQLQRGGFFRADRKFVQLGAELDQAAARASKPPAR